VSGSRASWLRARFPPKENGKTRNICTALGMPAIGAMAGVSCEGEASTQARPVAKQQAAGAQDAWRSDMAAFVREADRVFSSSAIPPEQVWKPSPTGPRLAGTIILSKGDTETGAIPPKDSGIFNEFSGNLVERFPGGRVTWTGVVADASLR
jgi:hypothetical protein